MRLGSLCTGIGGLDLAAETVYGAELAWYAETDPAACHVVKAHWPNARNLGDLTRVTWRDLEPVDVLTAGYPCQPFSIAGQRKGSKDARHLWPAIARAVRVLRPRRLILENVPGHLSMGFGDVLRDLAAARFNARWCVLHAGDVGAPHERARLFVLARPTANPYRFPTGRNPGSAPSPESEDAGRGEPDHDHGSPDAARGRTDWRQYRPAIARWERVTGRPAPEPLDEGGLSPAFVTWLMGYPDGWCHGITRPAALRCLGNAVVPLQGTVAITALEAQWEP